MDEHPEVLVRCSSEFPFYPAVQKMIEWYKEGAFGQIIEASLHQAFFGYGFDQAINWKRTLSANGEYGCMGDSASIRSTCRSGSECCLRAFRRSWRTSPNPSG
jgi:hypothetical protein